MNIIDKLEKLIKDEINKIGYDDDIKLNVSNRPDLGDYQFNGAFNMAKKYHESPISIAEKIVFSNLAPQN